MGVGWGIGWRQGRRGAGCGLSLTPASAILHRGSEPPPPRSHTIAEPRGLSASRLCPTLDSAFLPGLEAQASRLGPHRPFYGAPSSQKSQSICGPLDLALYLPTLGLSSPVSQQEG